MVWAGHDQRVLDKRVKRLRELVKNDPHQEEEWRKIELVERLIAKLEAPLPAEPAVAGASASGSLSMV